MNEPADMLFDDAAHEFDALLVVSFGGPEGPDDVMPFLGNVFRGLRVTDETKQRIAARYHAFGGVSPINGHTRAFIGALETELAANGPRLPVYWGNRNWHPLLPETLARMSGDGVRRAAVYVTSAFSSYSGCRKYREDLFEAAAAVDAAPQLHKLRVGFNHPGFIEAMSDRIADALDRATGGPDRTRVLFTAHSLPIAMAAGSPYVAQLEDASASVAARLGLASWALVYQSNNARYGGEPWLGPDIGDALEAERQAGVDEVIVAPIGFVCDHMEVVLDLDIDAKKRADVLGLGMIRAATVGTHAAYVRTVRDLVVERSSANPARPATGGLGPKHDFCPADCCLSGRPGPAKPSLCGSTRFAYQDAETSK